VVGGLTGSGGAVLAKKAGEVAAKHLPVFVREFFELYLNKRSCVSTFGEYLDKGGREELHALCRKYEELPSFETNKDFYRDWSA
jgi:sulfite reductase (ferredoxin)